MFSLVKEDGPLPGMDLAVDKLWLGGQAHFRTLMAAVRECVESDVRDRAVYEALDILQQHARRSAPFDDFRKSMGMNNAAERFTHMSRALVGIRKVLPGH